MKFFSLYCSVRELPVPLLTREYLQAFASVTEISDLKEQVRTLNLLILLLPGVHQRVLKVMCVLLVKGHKSDSWVKGRL